MATIEKLKIAEKELDKATRLLAIIDFSFSSKFSNRRDKAVNELSAFSYAVRRQINPVRIRDAKIAALEAELQKLKQELGE